MSEFEWSWIDDEQVRAEADEARRSVEFFTAALVMGAPREALGFCHPDSIDRWVLEIDTLGEVLTGLLHVGIGTRASSLSQYPDRRYYTVANDVTAAQGRNNQDSDVLVGVAFHFETGRWLVTDARSRDGQLEIN